MIREIRQAYVTSQAAIKDLAEEHGVPETTIYDWCKKEGWVEEKERVASVHEKLRESIGFLMDPKNHEDALAKGNLRVLLQIQGMHLAHMQYAMMTGDHQNMSTIFPSGLADAIQKYANSIEKINKTFTNIENGGVDKKEVTHKHQIDMDQALQLALKVKRETGQAMTVGEAAKLLEEQVKREAK